MYRSMVSGIILHHTDVSSNSIHDFHKSKYKIKQLTVKDFKDNAVTVACVRNYMEITSCFTLGTIYPVPNKKPVVSIL